MSYKKYTQPTKKADFEKERIMDHVPYTFVLRHNLSNKFFYGHYTKYRAHPTLFWYKNWPTERVIRDLIKQDGKEKNTVWNWQIEKTFTSAEDLMAHKKKFLNTIVKNNPDMWLNKSLRVSGIKDVTETKDAERLRERDGCRNDV